MVGNHLKDPYKWSNEELLSELCNAAAHIGMSHIAIDLTGSDYSFLLSYYKGIILSRLEGVQPPFKNGDKVKPIKESVRPLNITCGEISLPEELTVDCIVYHGNNSWTIRFSEMIGRKTFFNDPDYDTVHKKRCWFYVKDFEAISHPSFVITSPP